MIRATTGTQPSGLCTTTSRRLARNHAVSTRLHDDDSRGNQWSPCDYLSGLCLPLARCRDGRIAVYIRIDRDQGHSRFICACGWSTEWGLYTDVTAGPVAVRHMAEHHQTSVNHRLTDEHREEWPK